MGSTILAILTAIGGLFVLAGLVALLARRLGWFRSERPTEQMRAIPELLSGSELFVRNQAAVQSAIDRGAPRLREISVAAWASRVIVLNAPVVNIGRSLDNDVVLPDDPVSGKHCRLERHGSTFRLTDLGSKNKTWVNGRPVDEVVLREGDKIRVGQTTFVFECAKARG